MISPLSIFSPSHSFPLSFEDEYALSSFGLSEDQPSSSSFHSFASLSGLAEQLCSSSSPTSSHSSYNPPSSAYTQAQSSIDDLFGKDLYSDFSSSDDDFFTPTFSVTDLPSPSPNRSDYYPATPPPTFAVAAPHSKSSSASSSWNGGGGGGGAGTSFNSWDQQQSACDPVEVCYPSSTEDSWLVEETESAEVGTAWGYPETVNAPASRLANKASMESLGEWDGVENVPESWSADDTFFSSNSPAWTAAVPSSPSSAVPSPAIHQRAAHRTRSNPSIQPSTPRTHLPAKASMPALREEAADDAYSYIFDGGAPSNGGASIQSTMFAVLGGYGGEEQSLGQEWNSRTVGGDAYGGGWSAPGPSQRFEVENAYPSVIPTSLMGGGSYQPMQTPRSVSSSSSVPSTPRQQTVYSSPSPQHEFALPPPSPSARSFITPQKLSRRVSPIIPTLVTGRRPSTAPSQPLLSTGPLAPRRASTAPSTPKAKPSSSKRPIPAALARAQAVVQMHQQEQEREREEYRRTAADRKVDPFLASVLIQGWEPSAESAAALIVQEQAAASPPPRPIARLPSPRSTPSTPTPRRASPTISTPRANQYPAIEAPAHKGGYTTFINYTMADAESLLMGVAPSGAPQPKKQLASAPKKRKSEQDLGKEAKKTRA